VFENPIRIIPISQGWSPTSPEGMGEHLILVYNQQITSEQSALCSLCHSMRRDLLGRIQRIFLLISILLLLVIGLLSAQSAELPWASGLRVGRAQPTPPPRPQVVLISGHKDSDSGAVCTDTANNVTLAEADVTTDVAQRVVASLRGAPYDVEIFAEFDERLNGLRADALVSLHADSCVSYSGYKAAHRDNDPSAADSRLLACLDQHYPGATGLAYHPDTITRDMIDYHAFRKIERSTPAVILEMGFLGGDGPLLTGGADRVAAGIVESIRCFLDETEAS